MTTEPTYESTMTEDGWQLDPEYAALHTKAELADHTWAVLNTEFHKRDLSPVHRKALQAALDIAEREKNQLSKELQTLRTAVIAHHEELLDAWQKPELESLREAYLRDAKVLAERFLQEQHERHKREGSK